MMNTFTIDPKFSDPDGFFKALIEAHEGLTDDQSEALNARLILVLANQIGDQAVLREAIDMASGKLKSTI